MAINRSAPSRWAAIRGIRAMPPGMAECLLAAMVCSDSAWVQKDGVWDAQGDPTEVALIVAAHKAGLAVDAVKARLPRLDAVPFESQHQFMATLHEDAAGERTLSPSVKPTRKPLKPTESRDAGKDTKYANGDIDFTVLADSMANIQAVSWRP